MNFGDDKKTVCRNASAKCKLGFDMSAYDFEFTL
jgi:hypothetical protein